MVRSLLGRGYQGRIHPVNPRGGTLLGLPVAESPGAVDGGADLAVICTPAPSTPQVVEACAAAGMGGAVVLAVGFGEMGEEGRRLEARLRDVARSTGIRLVGPNTSGLMNLSIGLDLIGVPNVPAGSLALLAQSGNVTLGLMREAEARGTQGFSICVGVGNETDIAFHEYLEYLAEDRATRAILLYAEGFGSGRAFLDTAREVVARKPVVLLKGGRSAPGEQAARSHTGAVATGHRTVQAALRQGGVLEVQRSDELLAVGSALALQPATTTGRGLAILSDGGGQGTLAADTLSGMDVPLAALEPLTRQRLKDLLGQNAGVENPVDLAGAADRNPSVFPRALQLLLADPEVSGVLLVGLFGGYALRFAAELADSETDAAGELARHARRSGKPLVVHSMYAGIASAPLERLRREGIPIIWSLETACRAIAATWERGTTLGKLGAPGEGKEGEPTRPVRPLHRLRHGLRPGARIIAGARREDRDTLLEPEVRELLHRYGLPMVEARFCRDRNEVEQAARRIAGPLVLKVVSATITHKSDAGGVVMGVEGPRQAGDAWEEMAASVTRYATRHNTTPSIRGVLISPKLSPPVTELLVGVRRDPSFGPVVTVGAGGTDVEISDDVTLRIPPIERSEARQMLEELRLAPILRGYRGRPGIDLDGVTEFILNLIRFAVDHPEIGEVEVNPVFAYPHRTVAVDARAHLNPENEPAVGPGRTLPRPHDPR